MSRLFWLNDEQWSKIEPLLPHYGSPPRVDDRRILSGIIHVLRCGCRWCDCPLEYGPYTTVYNRFNRWSCKGIWQNCLVSAFDGALFSDEWKDALWDKFCTGAPARRRRSVEQYRIVKRA